MDNPSPHVKLLQKLEAYLTSELGHSCLERFKDPNLRQEYLALLESDASVEDAVLKLAHREAALDRHIADEFLGHFLLSMMNIGHFYMSNGLRRFLETGDLVNSVASSLWQELADTEFRTRREFLAYLGKRLQWKASDCARGFCAGKRREDLQRNADFEEQGVADPEQAGPSTIVGNKDEMDRLTLLLLRLPERDREILRLWQLHQDYSKIAAVFEIDKDSARRAVQRAMEKASKLS